MAFKMSNPVLNDARFGTPTEQTGAGWAAPTTPGAAAPVGPPPEGKTMTVGGTIAATAVLWVLLFAAGWWGFSQVEVVEVLDPTTGEKHQVADAPGWLLLLGLPGIALALVIAFVPKMARWLSPLYALCYGVLIGWISGLYQVEHSGIVAQALGATVAVFGVMLFLYGTRIIKVTKRFAMVVVGATLGIGVLYLGSFLLSMFGVDAYFWNEATPLGVAVSAGIAVVAALNLALDFAFIERASKANMPKYMEWYGAFGITVTIVWLYLELLRLISLLRQ